MRDDRPAAEIILRDLAVRTFRQDTLHSWQRRDLVHPPIITRLAFGDGRRRELDCFLKIATHCRRRKGECRDLGNVFRVKALRQDHVAVPLQPGDDGVDFLVRHLRRGRQRHLRAQQLGKLHIKDIEDAVGAVMQ
jgi:hypothetical protein